MYRILVIDPIPEVGLALLRDAPDVQVDDRAVRGAELHACIGDYDVLIGRSGTAVDRVLIEL